MQGDIGVKEALRGAVRHIILSALGRLVLPPKGPFLRALYFHGVADDSVENFESLMKKLRRLGKFVDTETLISMLEARTALEGKYFHLSFDDGYRNVFKNATPILKRLEIPALFFVVTGMAGANNRRGEVERMTWEDLRTLQSWGFEVGSHSRTHPRFTELLDRSPLLAEIVGSKRDVEDHLGVECKYLAWPHGRKCDIDDRSLEAIVSGGYNACFGGFRGSVRPAKTSRFQIPRHHLEDNWSWAHVRYFACGHGEK